LRRPWHTDNGIRNPGSQEEEELCASVYPLHLEGRSGEVEKQPMFAVDSTEIGADDDEIDVCEGLAGLEFDHNEFGNEHIEAVQTDLRATIQHRDRELSREWDVTLSQLDGKSVLVDCLEKPWTEGSVNLDSGTDDASSQVFVFEYHSQLLPTFLGSWFPY
jgi:hypothetical protein